MSRGRKYTFSPTAGFKNSDVAVAAAMLIEAGERVYDVLSNVDDQKLHYVPEGSYLSIAKLVKHMAWAEMGWLSRLCEKKPPEELTALLGDPAPQKLANQAEGGETAEQLVTGIKKLRSEFSVPALAGIEDFDAPFDAEKGPNSVRQVLSHLLWHWTYHSGQVGITLLQAGYDYQWSFAENTSDKAEG